MANRFKTILILGAPGTGKGTQGKILGTIPGFYHCACGDVFRQLDIDSELGKTFYEYSGRGKLVPDDVTVRIWYEAIRARAVLGAYKSSVSLLILDGIPRTRDQADLMDQYIDVLKVMHLTCNDQEAMIRRLRQRAIKENRHDDADEKVIRNRWKIYGQETRPVLDHYPQNIIVDVNSVGTPVQILGNVLKTVIPIHDKYFSHA